MAIFDTVEQRMCVRIVYDGAGGTGKTTNLGSLCHLFATQHTTELFSPGELDGRTLYFDWVKIMAGVVCGFPLMCQVISVPGQTVLTPRRRHLLSTADVVVLVCDSSPAGAERARVGLALVDEIGGQRPLPLVVQANKQDQMHALAGAELLARLGREDAVVVEAIATEGIGVIDTFVTAVRAVARSIQTRSEEGDLRIEVGRAPGARALLARLEQQELDPEWAAEMFLEEAQASLLIAGGVDAGPVEVEARRGAPPMVPQTSVETGFIWPAHTGRQVLATLAADGSTERPVALDAEGNGELVAGSYLLRTSRTQRHDDREAAREALVRAARERTQLGHLLAPETVLVAQPARDGAWWLWTLRATMPTVPELVASFPDDAVALVRSYGAAVVEALRVCLRHDFTVDLEPDHFGMAGGAVRYVGDIHTGAAQEEALRAAMASAVAAVTRLGWDVGGFVESIDDELRLRSSEEEVARATAVMQMGGVVAR